MSAESAKGKLGNAGYRLEARRLRTLITVSYLRFKLIYLNLFIQPEFRASGKCITYSRPLRLKLGIYIVQDKVVYST